MQIELNRRTFLAVLGATAAAVGAAGRPIAAKQVRSRPAPPLHYFADTPNQPSARPRSAAITYIQNS